MGTSAKSTYVWLGAFLIVALGAFIEIPAGFFEKPSGTVKVVVTCGLVIRPKGLLGLL